MSKQLESIMGRMPKATPAPALQVVPNEEPTATAPVPEVTAAPTAAQPARREGRGARQAEAKPVPAVAAEPERSIQAYVPVSVAKALNMRAAQEDATVRSLILQGLKAIGFEISEEQIRDRRR